MQRRREWILRNAVSSAALIVLWNRPVLKPLRLVVIVFHEFFHALTALLTGGGVRSVEIASYESGLTKLYGGSPVIVYSSGYIGTVFLGAILLISGYRYPLKRYLYLILGLFLLVNTVIFVRNPFGWAFGILVGALFIVLFTREFWFSSYVTDFLGCVCIIDSLFDLSGLIFASPSSRTDAGILHELTGIPYAVILISWVLVALLMVFTAIWVPLNNLRAEKVEQHLEWDEFRFLSRRAEKRRFAMTRQESSPHGRQASRTVVVYLSIIAAVAVLILYSSRFVLFQPWTAREWVGAAAAEGMIYVAGGRDRQGLLYDEILRIDPARRHVRTVARLPTERFGVAAVADAEQVLFIGGFDGKRCYDEVLRFDPATRSLDLLTRLPSPRTFGTAAGDGGKVYYLGGWDGESQLDEVVVIDISDGTSKILSRLPGAREFAASAVARGRIYLLGGSDERGAYLDEVLAIDPASGGVRHSGKLPTSRVRSAAVSIADIIYLCGGWEGRGIDEILKVSPADHAVTTEPFTALPRGVSDAAAVRVDDGIFIVGGTNETFQRQISVLRVDALNGEVESLRLRGFPF